MTKYNNLTKRNTKSVIKKLAIRLTPTLVAAVALLSAVKMGLIAFPAMILISPIIAIPTSVVTVLAITHEDPTN